MCTSTSVISTPGNRRCTLAFRLHGTPSSIFVRGPIFVILKFKRAHLKFSVYGRKQTDRQTDRHTYIHTHMCNAVTLVWGSLRLAPITTLRFLFYSTQICYKSCISHSTPDIFMSTCYRICTFQCMLVFFSSHG